MNNVEAILHENELIIKLNNRIDSTNSAQFEEEIRNAIDSNTYSTIVFDVENLEYISSAGLRIVLRIRKENTSIEIINAQPEVYEIFDMTGFTEMMPVKRAYRRVNIDGCKVIGEGATGRVYRIDPETIVKYYFKKDALPDIHRERELARKAFVLGIPTAIPYDVVKVEDGYGSVFELLNADQLVNLIIENPEKIDDYITLTVDILKNFHSTDVNANDVPSKREIGIKWANQAASFLPEYSAKKLIALFEALEDSNKLLHGDFHIKNVMMQNGEALLIDMDTLCRGNAVYEFAGMFNAYIAYSDLNKDNSMEFFGVPFETTKYIFDNTLKQYLGTDDEEIITSARNRAALVGYTEMVKDFASDDPTSEAAKHYITMLTNLIDKVDSISF